MSLPLCARLALLTIATSCADVAAAKPYKIVAATNDLIAFIDEGVVDEPVGRGQRTRSVITVYAPGTYVPNAGAASVIRADIDFDCAGARMRQGASEFLTFDLAPVRSSESNPGAAWFRTEPGTAAWQIVNLACSEAGADDGVVQADDIEALVQASRMLLGP